VSSAKVTYGAPQTRTRILRAAWRLIEQKGTTPGLQDVAREADVSRQAVYLHFGDRAGLLVALVEFIDESLNKETVVAEILGAPTGEEALERMVRGLSVYTGKVDSVARVLEAFQYQDAAVAAAWRNRMSLRIEQTRAIVQRIADEGRLADGWTVETATELCYTILMPGPWRELVHERGWTPEQYAEHMMRLLRRSMLRP
jgi:AcrR family transcriptional regulator